MTLSHETIRQIFDLELPSVSIMTKKFLART